MTLQRLVITFKPEELVLHALYKNTGRSQSGNEGTHLGSSRAGQIRAAVRPRGPRGRRPVRGHFGIHHEGGLAFGHNLTGCRQASEGSMMGFSEAAPATLPRAVVLRMHVLPDFVTDSG